MGFAGSLVFYNTLLPHLAPPELQDDVSSRGYAYGYLGGGLLLLAHLVVIFLAADTAYADLVTRLSIASVGVWWFGWALWTFIVVPEPKLPSEVRGLGPLAAVSLAFAEFGRTLRELRKFRVVLCLPGRVPAVQRRHTDSARHIGRVRGRHAPHTPALQRRDNPDNPVRRRARRHGLRLAGRAALHQDGACGVALRLVLHHSPGNSRSPARTHPARRLRLSPGVRVRNEPLRGGGRAGRGRLSHRVAVERLDWRNRRGRYARAGSRRAAGGQRSRFARLRLFRVRARRRAGRTDVGGPVAPLCTGRRADGLVAQGGATLAVGAVGTGRRLPVACSSACSWAGSSAAARRWRAASFRR